MGFRINLELPPGWIGERASSGTDSSQPMLSWRAPNGKRRRSPPRSVEWNRSEQSGSKGFHGAGRCGALYTPQPMAPPLRPNSADGTTATVPSLPLSPGVSEVADKKRAEMDPFREKPPLSNQKQEEKNASDRNLAKDSSDDELLEFMLRVDPNGFLLVMFLVSTLVLAWRFCWLFDKPAEQFWNTSLLLWLLLFVWTILVSDRPQKVISPFCYILLLSCAATHFIGQMNGMLVMYIGTLYAAGLLGYTTLGYCQRLGIVKSALALVTCKAKCRKHDEVGVSLLRFLISIWSLVCFARIAWLVLAPDTSHRTLFEASDYVFEMYPEICGSFGMWIMYITQFDLGGAILSMDTLAWPFLSFLCAGWLIGITLFLAIGNAVAILFLWIGTMTLMGFFGYVLALRVCCKTFIASRYPSTKWAQRSDKVYLTIELADAKDVMLKLKPDGHFNFSAKGPDEIPYELHLELFGAINVQESDVAVTTGTICYLIKKAESNWWPRLFKKEGEPPVFLKVDLDKWQDEDDEVAGSGEFGGMDFFVLV